MDLFSGVIILIFIFSIVVSVYRNYQKYKTAKRLKDANTQAQNSGFDSQRAGSVMDRHAEWDQTAWDESAGGTKMRETEGGHGHKIPSWDKPEWDKSPFGEPAEPVQKIGFGYFLLLLAHIISLVSLIYNGYLDYEFQLYEAKLGVEAVEGLDLLVNFEAAAYILLIFGLIYSLYLLLKKSEPFPKWFVFLHISMLVLVLLDAWANQYLFPDSAFLDSFLWQRDLSLILVAVLFIPYVHWSKGVKATFIER